MISSSSLSVMVSKSANVSVWDIDGLRGKHRRQLTHKMCPKHLHNLWWIKVKKEKNKRRFASYLVSLRHEEVQSGAWQPQLNEGLY